MAKTIALEGAVDVRFGSEADMCSVLGDVRFTPKSGHMQCNSVCPLCANSGHFFGLRGVDRDLRPFFRLVLSRDEMSNRWLTATQKTPNGFLEHAIGVCYPFMLP